MLELFFFALSGPTERPPESEGYNYEWVDACRAASGLDPEYWDEYFTYSFQLLDDEGNDDLISVVTLAVIETGNEAWVDCYIDQQGKVTVKDWRF